MSKWKVYYNPEELKELYSRTSYNLKKDIKDIKEEQLQDISEEIARQLHFGFVKGSTEIYFGKKRKASYAKIRIIDCKKEEGKSSGFRCIVLIDYTHEAAFMMHLYKHGKKAADRIKQGEKNKLKALVDDYIESIEHEESI